MGLFDDVKSSIKGSDSSSESDFDNSKFDSSFQGSQSSQGGQPMNENDRRPNTVDNNRNPSMNDNVNDSLENDSMRGPEHGQTGSSRMDDDISKSLDPQGSRPESRRESSRNDSYDSPNPRAGRPREGGSEPQLSSETERKMKNAGFQMDDSRNQGRRNTGHSSESVADRRDDLEEIKSQNEQIIELLKRLNDSLNGGTRRHGGRR